MSFARSLVAPPHSLVAPFTLAAAILAGTAVAPAARAEEPASHDSAAGSSGSPNPGGTETPSSSVLFAWSEATATGDCQLGGGDIVVTPASDPTMRFSRLVVDLAGGSPDAAATSTCTLRVPVTLPQGFYVAALVQRFRYSVLKGTESSVGISGRVTFPSQAAPAVAEAFPRGSAVDRRGAVLERTDTFAPGSPSAMRQCSGRNREILGIDVAVTALRAPFGEAVRVSLDAMVLREGIELRLQRCGV